MKEWLRETHGPGVELLRHFLRRFFDSDLITTPGQMTTVLIGAFPVFSQWYFLLVGPMRHKYALLSRLAEPGPYREAVRADELWLITFMMSAIGLLTAIKWQSLFPDLRDYRAVAALPVRPRQIFAAKLAALLLVAAGATVTLNFVPSFGFPALSAGRWAVHSSTGARVFAHAVASVAACSFFFFGLLALQGVLLNLLRPRVFGRLTGYLQGCLVAVMLGLIVLSFSIQPQITKTVVQPEWARWLPPVWFLGFCQTLSGDPDPFMHVLADRAEASLAIAVVLALSTYLIGYHRHRTWTMEGLGRRARGRLSGSMLPGWLMPDPRQQAVAGFMIQTLARSSHHRMILMGYGGLGLAALLTGLIGMIGVVERERLVAAGFLYFHIVSLLVLLIGGRHLFSLPTELKANWIFQITEGEGRGAWLSAVDRFVLFWGVALMLILPLPLEVRLLGWRGVAEAALFLVLGLMAYECAFYSWEKLPFTCSHLPGKTPMWIVVMQFFGLITLVPVLHTLLLATLYNGMAFVMVLAVLLVTWKRVHGMRRQGRAELRLKYDEEPAPAIYGLNLLK
jgi:hypothetical protein